VRLAERTPQRPPWAGGPGPSVAGCSLQPGGAGRGRPPRQPVGCL